MTERRTSGAQRARGDAEPAGAGARASGRGGGPRVLTEHDLWLLGEGRHWDLGRKLGAQLVETDDGRRGTHFAVWAPDAVRVHVVGDFDGWRRPGIELAPQGSSGVWAGFVEGIGDGTIYKYHVESRYGGYRADKADPVGFQHETPPRTASIVRDLSYEWGDAEWMRERGRRNSLEAPIAVYELHLGSWRRVPEEGGRPLTYRELADALPDYLADMGYTHVELLPVMEHPFGGSWGYQATGYFAPTSRYGSPQDFMHLVDRLHRRGIGVILDWAPAHFPSDEHGLAFFDGTHLYEHSDTRKRVHPDWNSYVFNFGRNEVVSFLVSSAMHWLDRYHVDGLRVDAVASMLYLDYSRKPGEWEPNRFGGNEDLEALRFLRTFNEAVYERHPDVQTIAEESTAWPMVSRPTYVGGLGFGLKWDMGWMHDTLHYLHEDPIHRRYHHDRITFRAIYAFTENYVLPLSHDEVVHGKRSLLEQMPGDDWQKFANLRLLLTYMTAQPGKKMLFMGGEIGQRREWSHDASVDWHLLEHESHAGIQRCVRRLNELYREVPALHELDCRPEGFEWVDASDALQSVLCFLRKAEEPGGEVLCVFNFTPVPRESYAVGVPRGGFWRELHSSDAREFWGSGWGNLGGLEAAPVGKHGRPYSLHLTLPPLGGVLLRHEG